ncbi:MAG TPA: ribose-phosphate pyrophosphokinase [Candidatus Hydrogenedentes bacterium]|nr:ribose-phosphate pyrophosphokinase [Candidatus Hydrogenedentota bacterium]
MASEKMLVFGGSGSPKLTEKICRYLKIPHAKSETLRFSEGNLFVRIQENVRGRHVYFVQSTAYPANDNFMELLFGVDALKRASAASVTVVMPYFSYAKGDKKDEPRVSIRARVCADAMEVAGADRVITMDLHAPQIQGFFRVPVDDLYAMPVLCDAVRKMKLRDLVVVSPDTGFAKKARNYANYLGAPLAIGDKERVAHDEKAEVLEIIGDVKGKSAFVVDDFTISGGTLIEVARALLQRGAKDVIAAVTHGLFSPGSMKKIEASPIRKMLITDTVETQPEPFTDKVEIVSVAPLFGEAIRRIHDRESISVLFTKKPSRT